MPKLSKHFTEKEFRCHCGCGQMIVNKKLLKIMEILREILNKPITVHCVNRCKKHNGTLKNASPTSKHLKGDAIDFHVRGMSNKKLHHLVTALHKSKVLLDGGLGLYVWGVHIDIKKYRSWGKSL